MQEKTEKFKIKMQKHWDENTTKIYEEKGDHCEETMLPSSSRAPRYPNYVQLPPQLSQCVGSNNSSCGPSQIMPDIYHEEFLAHAPDNQVQSGRKCHEIDDQYNSSEDESTESMLASNSKGEYQCLTNLPPVTTGKGPFQHSVMRDGRASSSNLLRFDVRNTHSNEQPNILTSSTRVLIKNTPKEPVMVSNRPSSLWSVVSSIACSNSNEVRPPIARVLTAARSSTLSTGREFRSQNDDSKINANRNSDNFSRHLSCDCKTTTTLSPYDKSCSETSSSETNRTGGLIKGEDITSSSASSANYKSKNTVTKL